MITKIFLKIALLCIFLTACVNIEYKPRNDSVEGYLDKDLGQNRFEVSFQTYHQGDYYDEIKHLAIKRAGEISLKNEKPFFKIISEQFDTSNEIVTIPEQKIRSFITASAGSPISGSGQQEIEAIIPAHNKEFTVQLITLVIELLSEFQEDALKAQSDK